MCDIRVSRAQARVECAATAPICIIRVSLRDIRVSHCDIRVSHVWLQARRVKATSRQSWCPGGMSGPAIGLASFSMYPSKVSHM